MLMALTTVATTATGSFATTHTTAEQVMTLIAHTHFLLLVHMTDKDTLITARVTHDPSTITAVMAPVNQCELVVALETLRGGGIWNPERCDRASFVGDALPLLLDGLLNGLEPLIALCLSPEKELYI
jgi:hypothetical protein